jgi:hypothetical protein
VRVPEAPRGQELRVECRLHLPQGLQRRALSGGRFNESPFFGRKDFGQTSSKNGFDNNKQNIRFMDTKNDKKPCVCTCVLIFESPFLRNSVEIHFNPCGQNFIRKVKTKSTGRLHMYGRSCQISKNQKATVYIYFGPRLSFIRNFRSKRIH